MLRIDPNKTLALPTLRKALRDREEIGLSGEAEKRIEECRRFLEQRVKNDPSPIYGINTGFGALCETSISDQNLETLQHNLVVSHACGTGPEVPEEIVRTMLLLKIRSLSYGHSGIRPITVQRLAEMFNRDVLPVVYEQGSLGASGDLAPLAHLSLPLIGKGEVRHEGTRKPAEDVLTALGWDPLTLQSKEGLALLNGTQFMTAFGISCLLDMEHLLDMADLIGALSAEAFDCHPQPFDQGIQEIRKQPGQQTVGDHLRHFLKESSLSTGAKRHVQDPYSFRCMPQVHGACRDSIAFCHDVLVNEVNSVTDNPTLFPDRDTIISAGNFHGQPLAMALDQLSIASAELGSISERRVYRLLSGERGLPPFLIADPGLHSGFMIPQYTAASVASQNKQSCTPSSVDTIESSNGQEDHVSMGANSATKALKVVRNLKTLLSIELFTAAQAIEFRGLDQTSPTLQKLVNTFREHVPFLEKDVEMHREMEKSRSFLEQLKAEEFLDRKKGN